MTSLFATAKDSLSKITVNHPLWKHEFLARCRTGKLSLDEVRILAVQMYKFCKEFNRILASALSYCEDDSAQLVILENIFDEMGRGDLNKSHPELFRKFTQALNISDLTLAASTTAPETLNMIETYLAIPRKYGYLGALGAICYASEGIVSSLYTQLYEGIVDAAPLPKESLIFFEVHIGIDDSHAANLAKIIESQLTTKAEVDTIQLAVIEAMDARVQFFNGIQRQVSDFATNSPQLTPVYL